MADNKRDAKSAISSNVQRHVDQLCDDFAQQRRDGKNPTIGDFLSCVNEAHRPALRSALEAMLAPESVECEAVDSHDQSRDSTIPPNASGSDNENDVGRCPSDVLEAGPRSLPALEPEEDSLRTRPSGVEAIATPEAPPERIGRYLVERALGRGSFGRVYLAHDSVLQRQVAIKTPHPHLISNPEDAESYLAEARVVAKLDHPHIVPVHDVGESSNDPVFIVSKFVEGRALADHLDEHRVSHRESARLVCQVADAVDYAHRQGVVHRDIKPANLLLDSEGSLHVADFGMALREQDFGLGAELAGTPAYMSPEQARGESHLVDGRSDIFSLGAVFYEMLTGKRPFRASSQAELLRQIRTVDVRPPRQLDAAIPRELERICLKAMARQATGRYTTASDLAEDLRHFLSHEDAALSSSPGQAVAEPQPVQVVPKGLRSFDAEDSDFFLELLPGVRDREGLPESIRFWKNQIEKRDPDETFRVGLIYGPSGCGKSSLVKAGLLPRLAENVRPIYIEATANETETRLLAGLRKACPELRPDVSLKDAVAQLRLGQSTRASRKVVLIIDQFEQWLHARHDYADTELADALRQCDGGNVQVVVMVRDDFWMAVSRLFRDIDIPLLERKNSAAVDLFDLLHARKVLAEFGRAYTRLPDNLGQLSGEQDRFLDDAVTGLATEGKVISVRLALFSEMVKGKPWTPETLNQLGGISGVGVAFLEETFSTPNAPPAHRHHQQAARAVLKDLLPGEGTDIKGHWRSRQQLLEASGYANRPRDFGDLLRILDTELRLITPTDPEGAGDEESEQRSTDTSGVACYQLTHDYLVPALREWLTRKQKETRRGRAELRLEERTRLWNAKPENQQLPGWRETLNIRLLTQPKSWTNPEHAMMRKASRLHCARTAALLVVLLLLGWTGYEINGRFQSRALVENLLSAKEDAVLSIVGQLKPYRRWATPLLEQQLATTPATEDDRRRELHVRLALLPEDKSQADAVKTALLSPDTPYSYVGVLRDALSPPSQTAVDEQLIELLREDFRKPELPEKRFRAALALATYDPSPDHWIDDERKFLAEQLVAANPEHQPILREYLRPVGELLLRPIESLFTDSQLPETQQLGAANAVADFAGQDGPRLARMLSVATPSQYKLVYLQLTRLLDPTAGETLLELAAREPAADLPGDQRVALGKERAGAAITLLRRGAREESLAALRVRDDPESLTQFVHRCRDREVQPTDLLECVDEADKLRQTKSGDQRQLEDRAMFGLLLALGEFSLDELPKLAQQPLIDRLAAWYADDPSSTIHGATGWLLRRWGKDELAKKVDQSPIAYSDERQWYTEEIKTKTGGLLGLAAREQSAYLTFVVVPPGEYEIGSPPEEPERARDEGETRHKVRITRPFAILEREITWAEFAMFDRRMADKMMRSIKDQSFAPTLEEPMAIAQWYDSVRFCRWLSIQAGLSEEDQAYADPASLDQSKYAADSNPKAGGFPLHWPLAGLDRPGFRLPTESEWEIACRLGTVSAWSFGGDVSLLDQYGWFEGNSDRRTHVPRVQRPNLAGLFDMHGNVGEWCHDLFGPFTAAAVEDSWGPETGTLRVSRGGSWDFRPQYCRASVRFRFAPSYRNFNQGFRVVRGSIGSSAGKGSQAVRAE